MIAIEVIDLPQPDSPTKPIVSPGRTLKLTLSTTLTSPCASGNWMDKFLTSSRGAASGVA